MKFYQPLISVFLLMLFAEMGCQKENHRILHISASNQSGWFFIIPGCNSNNGQTDVFNRDKVVCVDSIPQSFNYRIFMDQENISAELRLIGIRGFGLESGKSFRYISFYLPSKKEKFRDDQWEDPRFSYGFQLKEQKIVKQLLDSGYFGSSTKRGN